LVREQHPPVGEEPVEWLLLTSLPIQAFKQVCRIIEYYCCRWEIEIYFRVLKSGCKVESHQFEDTDRYLPCLALYMVLAWRVMYVMMLSRECPDMSCADVFSEAEWKSVYVVVCQEQPPAEPPSLQEMVSLIGRLGGHLPARFRNAPGSPGGSLRSLLQRPHLRMSLALASGGVAAAGQGEGVMAGTPM
jgi:hypothetical protein